MTVCRAALSGSKLSAGVLSHSILKLSRRRDASMREQRQVDAEEGLCVHPGCVFVAVSEQDWFNKPCQPEIHAASEVSFQLYR